MVSAHARIAFLLLSRPGFGLVAKKVLPAPFRQVTRNSTVSAVRSQSFGCFDSTIPSPRHKSVRFDSLLEALPEDVVDKDEKLGRQIFCIELLRMIAAVAAG